MEIKELTTLLTTPDKLIEKVLSFKIELPKESAEEYKQFEPENQPILNEQHRPKKQVQKPTGIKNPDGTEATKTVYEQVARIPVAFQRIIVNRAIMFLTGIPVEFDAITDEPLRKQVLDMVEKTWDDNKMEFKLDEIAEAMMSENDCAVIFHWADADPEFWGELGLISKNAGPLSKRKLRHNVYKKSEGSTLYPVFNEVGDMTAFGREYEVPEGDKKVKHLDIYTALATYRYVSNESDGWDEYRTSKVNEKGELVDDVWPVPNEVRKIPVIYFHQKRVEWADVKWAIEQFVKTFSDLSETNAYFGSPILKATGKITGMASKGEKGKIFEMEKDADLEYVTWNQAPESIRLELDMLKEVIYTITQTPDITFKELKGLGQLSGIALRMMFLDPHAKANRKHRGNYGEGVQRMINYIKAAMGVVNITVAPATKMSIKPKFGTFLPENELEELEIQGKRIDNTLNASGGNKDLIAHDTAVDMAGLAPDAAAEFKKIQAQKQQELKEKAANSPGNLEGFD